MLNDIAYAFDGYSDGLSFLCVSIFFKLECLQLMWCGNIAIDSYSSDTKKYEWRFNIILDLVKVMNPKMCITSLYTLNIHSA